MTFVKPLLLWGMLLAALPIIIHLINRWRHRTIKWGAMSFLLRASKEARGRKKLRHYIILAMRALALAALFVAISRPRVSSMLGLSGSGVETIVLILDRSASMENRPETANDSLRAQAVERIKKTMPEMAGARLILIDSATGRPQEIASPEVLSEMSATAPTDSQADMPGLFQVAVDWLNENNVGKSEIWVASDMQKSDWQTESGKWEGVRAGIKGLASVPGVRILSLSDRPQMNHAIQLKKVQRRGDDLYLTIEIISNGKIEMSGGAIPLTISLNGAATTESVVFNGSSMTFTKRLPLMNATGEGYGYVSLSPDANIRDDRAYFVYGESKSVKNIVVAENGEAADTLALMASPPGWSSSSLEVLSPAQANKIDWENAGLVLWQGALPKGDVAKSATKFLENGGTILLFPDEDVNESPEAFEGLKWGKRETAQKDKYFVVKNWERKIGVLRDGLDGRPITLDTFKAIERKPLIVEGGTVLASWENESPSVWRKIVGNGQIVAMSSRAAYTWSNLGDGNVLLPVIFRLSAEASERFNSDRIVDVGSQASKPLPKESRERIDNAETKPDVANALYAAGVYQMGSRMVAVNRPAGEDEIEIVDEGSLAPMFEGISYRLFDQKSTDTGALASEIWRMFLYLMLVALLIEALLSLPAKYAQRTGVKGAGRRLVSKFAAVGGVPSKEGNNRPEPAKVVDHKA